MNEIQYQYSKPANVSTGDSVTFLVLVGIQDSCLLSGRGETDSVEAKTERGQL